MAQLEGHVSTQKNENGDNPSLEQWLMNRRLDSFHDKLISEGFEEISDFEDMNEEDIIQLWNKIGNNKIGIRKRFIKSIKKISLKPIVVITNDEQKTLSNLKETIKKYKNIFDTFETSMTGM